MNILLTGIGGAIGVHVWKYFMENTDHSVIGIDSFRHKGYKDRIDTFMKPEWENRTKIIQHDLVCPISIEMDKEIGDVDQVLHLAALSDVFFSVENPAYVAKNNIDSTIMILEWARNKDLESFIYFSTDEVYGPTTKDQAHKEWDTHRPSNVYAASKAACEDIAYAYWRSYDLPLIITNTMNNFGETQGASKFPAMIQRKIDNDEFIEVHGNKDQIGTRYYIHSEIVADALYSIIKHGADKHKLGELDEPLRYHIVGDVQLDNLELVMRIGRLLGKDIKTKLVDFHSFNPAHDIHYGLENNNLAEIWKPKKDFDEMMKQTIDWQTEHKEWL